MKTKARPVFLDADIMDALERLQRSADDHIKSMSAGNSFIRTPSVGFIARQLLRTALGISGPNNGDREVR